MKEKYLTTDYPNIFFEDNKVGQLKKRIWDASEAEIGGRLYAGITNVGTRPTADDSPEVTVETWFPDLTADLYGQPLRMEFFHRLRGERKFPTLQALADEIAHNAQQTREYFSRLNSET